MASCEAFACSLAPPDGGRAALAQSFGFSRLREGATMRSGVAMPLGRSIARLSVHDGQDESSFACQRYKNSGGSIGGDLCRLPAAYRPHDGAAVQG